ncbi:hypothetical protein CMI40_00045 [Candidatus Pacearchaeota archaeon]|jgi:orotate phosphoribosyltransferase|nr:hypothetical protein [Candidatus Pacearchaeota archaeon]|tara:strand:- start:11319 stop:12116 length:798 start_codon:yes stop_codon:yes gene_type:complete
MDKVNRELQKKHLDILVKNKGFQFTDSFFPYTSGQIGPYYVQSEVVMKDAQDYQEACSDLTDKIHYISNLDNIIISGGESRDWIFSNIVSINLDLPHVMIYKDGRTIGVDIKNKNVIHVADLNNEGSSPRDLWVPAIEKAKGRIKDIYFYVDRMEDGVKVMKDLELNSNSLVPLDKYAWNYLEEKKVITKEIYKNLKERGETKESRKEWVENMLRSEKGLETLANLLSNRNSFNKGIKILDKGYPDLSKELIERLKKEYDLDFLK